MASADFSDYERTVDQLPEALSGNEVFRIGLRASLAAGAESPSTARRLTNNAVFNLGAAALYEKKDLVTAESAVEELRRHGGKIGWFVLALHARKVRKQIIKDIGKDLKNFGTE